MKLWDRFASIEVFRRLRMKRGAVITVENSDGTLSDIDLAELAAVNNIGAADLAKIDGITNGTAAAGKAVVLDSSGFIDLVSFGAIGAADSSLGINGLAAAQGGAIVITAGASSTATNAGGDVTLKGGTGNTSGAGGATNVLGGVAGATGVGGQVNITGGVPTDAAGGAVVIAGAAGVGTNRAGGLASVTGGASTGSATGGVASVVGGAASAATGAGGAAVLTGGAGNTSGAGGAITITSGAAGSSGVAGAVNIAVGGATAGNGSSMTLTGGNGAGGTASGGDVNIVPGTAVSTGVPGEFKVNGGSGLVNIAVAFTATDATRHVFVCTRAMRLKAASSVFSTASTSGTWTVEKLTGTTAAGSGTALLSGAVALSGSANTVANGTLIATVASLTFAAGDRVGIVIAGTMTNLVGGVGTITLAPV